MITIQRVKLLSGGYRVDVLTDVDDIYASSYCLRDFQANSITNLISVALCLSGCYDFKETMRDDGKIPR